MDQELQDLNHWLKLNAKHFREGNYDAYEIAQFARMNDFSWQVIYRVIPQAYTDIQTHSTYKLREDYHIQREIDHITENSGKPKLEEQWHHLMLHENGEDWAA